MPRQVDHEQRRQQIASALMAVAARDGLDAVSLRHVAAEAGVTSGMVQHYFPSKDAMMAFAMQVAGARYEDRMNQAVAGLGDSPDARELVGAILTALLPLDDAQRQDARVALAFQSYAATRPAAAAALGGGNDQLRAFLADQLRAAQTGARRSGPADPACAAVALLALAEGLGVQLLSTDLSADAAMAALDSLLDLTFDAMRR